MQLSERYNKALSFAYQLHKDDLRKGKSTPYLAHLLAVSSMVMDDGGTEDEAIGALLHDSLEDHADQVTAEYLVAEFGEAVAEIVRGCTDTPDNYDGGEKPPWKERKTAYIDHLKEATKSVLKVAIADKLHNARELLLDLQADGNETMNRFNVGIHEQVWYLDQLLEVFVKRAPKSIHLIVFREIVFGIKAYS